MHSFSHGYCFPYYPISSLIPIYVARIRTYTVARMLGCGSDLLVKKERKLVFKKCFLLNESVFYVLLYSYIQNMYFRYIAYQCYIIYKDMYMCIYVWVWV